MPELPEIEQIKRTLADKVEGVRIEQVKVLLDRIIRAPQDSQVFARLLTGKTIKQLERRGKYLLVRLSDHWTMVVHLRMTGQLLFVEPSVEVRFARIIFSLSNGYCLCYADNRTLGTIYLLPDQELHTIGGLAGLGPEPFAAELTSQSLMDRAKGRRIAIKSMLLDQRVIAGIGNIYADESLFAAMIHPQRPAGTLTLNEWEKLLLAVREVLSQAIANHGTTFRNYRDGNGEMGANQFYLRAYGKNGQPCARCGAAMVRITVGGRGTCFCPQCQH